MWNICITGVLHMYYSIYELCNTPKIPSCVISLNHLKCITCIVCMSYTCSTFPSVYLEAFCMLSTRYFALSKGKSRWILWYSYLAITYNDHILPFHLIYDLDDMNGNTTLLSTISPIASMVKGRGVFTGKMWTCYCIYFGKCGL